MNLPRRHHLVPQFYLKRFAREDLIEVVSRDDFEKFFRTSPLNALVERDFYMMESSINGPDPWVESELFAKQIEEKASRALRRVIDERIPLAREGLRSALALFIVFQFCRGQATRQPMVEAHKATARLMAEMMTPEQARRTIREVEGRDASDEEVASLLEFAKNPDGYRVDITHQNNLHIRFLADIAPLAEPLFTRSWQVLEFEEPLLITGDEPVGLVGSTLEPGERLGILTASKVVFPTDPHHAIVISRREQRAQCPRDAGTPEMANIINRHIAFRAHKHIVRAPGTDPLRGLVLPERAPMVSVEGNMIVSRFGISKAEAAKENWQARPKSRNAGGRKRSR